MYIINEGNDNDDNYNFFSFKFQCHVLNIFKT